MIQIQFMKPFYSKVKNDKLRLVFAYQYLSIDKDGELYHFVPVEGKEMIINLETKQIENMSDVFVFQNGNRYVRMPLYQMLLVSNIHEYLSPIIDEHKNYNPLKNTVSKEFIAKVNFKGFSDLPTNEKTYYFKTKINDLEEDDIVIVDSQGKNQLANFLGYADESKIHINPSKYILRVANEDDLIEYRYQPTTITTGKVKFKSKRNKADKNVQNSDPRWSEFNLSGRFSKSIDELFSQIMQFHKENLIDKYLENEEFQALEEFLNN